MSLASLFFSLFVLSQVVRARSVDEELEVVLLPMAWNNYNATVPLRFSAFGKQIDLLLKKNENLLAPNFEVWRSENQGLNRIDNYAKYSSCHYLHENSYSSAAVSLCDAGTVQGFIFLENDSLEITPLNNENSQTIPNSRLKVRLSSSSSFGEPHVIKRRRISSFRDAQDSVHVRMSSGRQESSSDDDAEIKPAASGRIGETLTIELAVFFDETAYKIFKAHFSGDEAKVLDLLLAYVNNIQALYHHPSLGQRIDLALVRLELMQSQPKELSHLDGERSEALDAFCKYSKSLNPDDDNDPRHWDMGLYVSGLDFYAFEKGNKNPVTMGLAPVGGVCWDDYACVIAEFGVNNKFGRPFPSAGFTSVYIAAHEMAHNLGMHHDSAGNDCPKDGFIMSPSRGVKGETHWSNCSRDLALSLASTKKCLLDQPGIDYRLEPHRHLDHKDRFGQVPGRHWTAKRQCELLLRDPDAFVDSLENSCTSLRCRTPNRTGFYLAGPALDGTKCHDGKECRAGECLPIKDNWEVLSTTTPLPKPPSSWSDWNESSCESGCIRGSLGFIERRRNCLGDTQCSGLSFDVVLCKDSQVCEGKSRKRLTTEEHAGLRCLEFSTRGIEVIDPTAAGLQATHEFERPWIACAVFCKRKDIASYYTPRIELNDLGVDPYFPDGTWCHRDDEQDYFCRKHHCLPENFRFGKGLDTNDDDDLGPLNAASSNLLPSEIQNYFSLDLNGQPLARTIEGGRLSYKEEDDPKDYVEIPVLVM